MPGPHNHRGRFWTQTHYTTPDPGGLIDFHTCILWRKCMGACHVSLTLYCTATYHIWIVQASQIRFPLWTYSSSSNKVLTTVISFVWSQTVSRPLIMWISGRLWARYNNKYPRAGKCLHMCNKIKLWQFHYLCDLPLLHRFFETIWRILEFWHSFLHGDQLNISNFFFSFCCNTRLLPPSLSIYICVLALFLN